MAEVSIVMPVYNGERYLRESIDSVVGQTFQDWELILVNDCSTDGSLSIMEEYACRDSRIQIIDNPVNLKLPRSLNKGFSRSSGNYLTWTSDDNRYHKGALEAMWDALEQDRFCGLVYCDMDCVDEAGVTIGGVSAEAGQLYLYNCVGACFLYRREILDTVGEYDPAMFLVEDYDYWLRINRRYQARRLPERLYDYRYHGKSLTETRAREVAGQLYKLRVRELDFLLERIDEEDKSALFLDMFFQNGRETLGLRTRFFRDGTLPEEIRWIERGRDMDNQKQSLLFGAGTFGRKALSYLGEENVYGFVDNNEAMAGRTVDGKPVISFQKLTEIYRDYNIVISVDARKVPAMARQLEESGITDFTTYLELVNCLKHPSAGRREQNILEQFRRACEWAMKNSVPGEGIANNSGCARSYPEVTGYFIPTLLCWGYRDLALCYARWLCGIQNEDGSWNDTEGRAPYVFDTAQILKGLMAIKELCPFVETNIRKGCDWILGNVRGDGRLTTPTREAWGEEGMCSELIHLYCLSPLAEAGRAYGVPKYTEAAKRVADYYIANRREDILSFNILSHFYAYVMEALCDIGETGLARQAMDKVAAIQREDGSVPAYEDVNWVCSTGLFQLALVWFKLGDLERGNRAFDYAAGLQNESGGWYGSYPVKENPSPVDRAEYPDYFADREISWAVKYFLDAAYYKCKLEFESQADDFQESIDKEDGRYRAVLEEIRGLKPGAKVLDAGCGTGRYIRNLLEDVSGVEFCAVDMSERVMRKIQKPVEKKQGTLTFIPYPDESFDVVYAVESLEHAIAAGNAAAELIRVTKKGGKVIVIDKNRSALGMLEMDEWEQWFDDEFFKEVADSEGCALKSRLNIPYEDGMADGLFGLWVLCKG